MSERKSDEALRQWKYQTPEDAWNEMRRARAEEARLLEVVKKQEERIRAFILAAMPMARFVEAFNRQPLAQVRAANVLYGIHGGDACWPVGADVKLSDLEALAVAYAKAVSP